MLLGWIDALDLRVLGCLYCASGVSKDKLMEWHLL